MKESIWIESENNKLEGVINSNSSESAVIITHPHSLYGGDMHNNVVDSLEETYAGSGFTTLKFNFRGVGNSTGTYDEGVGEQSDLESTIGYLSQKGFIRIDLTGYSFGSWVIYNLAAKKNLENKLVFISPPVDFIKFIEKPILKSLSLIIVGNNDEFASLDAVSTRSAVWNPDAVIEVIPGADHFYSGKTRELQQKLQQNLTV
jgi:uncharacterized protein